MTYEQLLKENKKIYAQLCAVKNEIWNNQAKLDIEIALSGSILYHQDRFEGDKISKIITKLVILTEKKLILIDIYRDNLIAMRRIKENGEQTKQEN